MTRSAKRKKIGWVYFVLNHVSIIIPVAPGETAQNVLLSDLDEYGAEIILSSEGSRAASLNAGAKKANREFLWFLHADSRVSADNIATLARCLKREPSALHYFFLSFGYGRPSINAWMANIRSAAFRLPYGDQGFCIAKTGFEKIGGYPEMPYGEDLLFIRKARELDVPLSLIPSKLRTSARKYREVGWLKLTAQRHIQFWKLMRQKL